VWLNALGFTNRSLRAQVRPLLGVDDYTVNQMSYDLARLRRKGLIEPRPGINTYDLTPEGQRVAIFYTKVHDRLLGPLIAAVRPPAPAPLRRALATIETHIDRHIEHARLASPEGRLKTQDKRQTIERPSKASATTFGPIGPNGQA
jgi:hypothetical protein